MKFFAFPDVLLILSFSSLSFAASNSYEHQARAACKRDNVYRALLQHPSEATEFCGYFANIPTPTKFVTAKTIKKFSVTTETVTYNLDVYPDGRHDETFEFPSYLTSFSALRVSSACTCVVTPATTTVTVSSSIETSTATVIATSTLTGICATNIPYQGAFEVSSPGGQMYDLSSDGVDEFICCQICRGNRSGFKDCIGYIAGPGVCYVNAYELDERGTTLCPEGNYPATFTVQPTKYPNNYGGPGPCAAKASVVSVS